MIYNFTGGAFPTPTPLLFDPASGTWHLPEPANYDAPRSFLRVSYERAIARLSVVGTRLRGDLPAASRNWRAA